MQLRPRFRAAVLVAALAVLASGCSSGSGLSAGDQGFVSGDGKVTVLDEADRKAPKTEVAGESLDGEEVALSDHLGKVVVMPVWGSWCAPCRAEAPLLAEAAKDLEDDGVVFLGINSRDPNVTEAQQFVDDFGIPYDSIHDPDGRTLLAFHGTLPPQTVPSFVFIDAEGRVAGRALDKIGRSTLYGVVEDVLGHEVSSDREKS
ncbi:TlpA disulfide reductase family protein [Nocardioides caldifontis]|uniref:TlpA disulfide reductase family protein n=1 Tax=Nocardioides caldifontis TaxID=2588938 RepID=UPI001396C703|nr:TlpA disulfide reductase family protein [Nocardioides caldifontis]